MFWAAAKLIEDRTGSFDAYLLLINYSFRGARSKGISTWTPRVVPAQVGDLKELKMGTNWKTFTVRVSMLWRRITADRLTNISP